MAAFLFGFILSFAVGANDSANSWGTPVGAKTVTLGVAFLLGSICESAGSIFLSKNVIDGISGNTSIVRMSMYQSDNATEVLLFEEEKFDVSEIISYLSKCNFKQTRSFPAKAHLVVLIQFIGIIYERKSSYAWTRNKYGCKSDVAIGGNMAWLASEVLYI